MNEILWSLGVEGWKPLLTALVLPPLPLLLLVLFGAWQMRLRPGLGFALVLLATAGLWLGTTKAAGQGLTIMLLRPPLALGSSEIADLRKSPKTAIVVLGGGRRSMAAEYGTSTLKPRTLERLRYGVWLARETGLPLAFSGGIGHGAGPGPSEAEIAARVAEREFGRPLRWQEGQSRDTRENAEKTVALLAPQGIDQIVVVTHAYHMRRAIANFARAAEGRRLRIIAAPLSMRSSGPLQIDDWLPSVEGFEECWLALHEWLGRLVGA